MELNTHPSTEIKAVLLADTLAEQAYAELSKMIQKREFKGGQQLVELRLAKQLGISRTPVRQALRRLEGEGLLQKSGSRHYFVRRVELQEYLHSLKVREILEAEAAFTAANNVSETDIKNAQKTLIGTEGCDTGGTHSDGKTAEMLIPMSLPGGQSAAGQHVLS